jgi:hypothetical protein
LLSNKIIELIINNNSLSDFGVYDYKISCSNVKNLKDAINDIGLNHDSSKINNQKLFRDWNKEFVNSENISNLVKIRSSLYKHYGDNFDEITDERKEATKTVVIELNKIDSAWTEKLIKSYNLPKNICSMIKSIEKIADLVDRGLNPVTPEELGKKNVYLGSNDKSINERMVKYALFLEKNYDKLTKNLNLDSYVKKSRYSLYQNKLKKSMIELNRREEIIFSNKVSTDLEHFIKNNKTENKKNDYLTRKNRVRI